MSPELPIILAPLLLAVALQSGPAQDLPDFNRDIRPILSDNCYRCHGPDPAQRQAGLRFDRRAAAVAPLPSGRRAIVAGDLAASALIDRISTEDPDHRMPPPETGKRLGPAQVALLRRWIAGGAPWARHWSFVPPRRPAPPLLRHSEGVRNPIDRFVRARLEHAGLAPSPPAARESLIRRVTLDLTGLPPTPEEIDAFLADRGTDAYEKIVRRLLASPRFGEHFARPWLDAARYADTNGYHIDNERFMWRWRDWVIDAYDRNLPFDQFTIEQLAGDLLPEPTTEQLVATGFNRNHGINFEGGIIPEEYQVEYVVDRVSTTSTVWLGLTMACARCHDHKFDPISQRDFYRFYAFFNNIDEKGSDGNQGNAVPVIAVPTEEEQRRIAALDTEVLQVEDTLAGRHPDLEARQRAWEEAAASPERDGAWQILDPVAVHSAGGATLCELPDHSVRASGHNPDRDVIEIEGVFESGPFTALRIEALTDPSLAQGSTGRADNGNFVLSEIEVIARPLSARTRHQQVRFQAASADHEQEGFPASAAIDRSMDAQRGWAGDGHRLFESRSATFVAAEPFGFPGGTRLQVRLHFASHFARHAIGRVRLAVSRSEDLEPLSWTPWQAIGPFTAASPPAAFETAFLFEAGLLFKGGIDLSARYDSLAWRERSDLVDGKSHALGETPNSAHYLYREFSSPGFRPLELSLGSDDGIRVWLNDEEVFAHDVARGVAPDQDRATLLVEPGRNRLLMKIVNHGGASGFYFRAIESAGALPAAVARALRTSSSDRSIEQHRQLRHHFLATLGPEERALLRRSARAEREAQRLRAAAPSAMVMRERADPRETFLLGRGQYDQKGEKVTAGVPEALPALPEKAPLNRLGLARWLVDPAHPLTARVAVNRIWQTLFGTGLVKTTEDFGSQGAWPSHPELLDWLATEFVRLGWDRKALIELIVTSATYRQASATTPELRERDPQNRLLARGSRHRLPAEVIRDTALFASGLLVEKVGGPSVRPYQPPGLWKEVAYGAGFTAQSYMQDQGEALWRRSLYTFWKRSSPPPSLLAFDAPEREFCTVRRPITNTPLQALVLLNDPTYVEAARVFAQRTLGEATKNGERLRRAFRRVTARYPDAAELVTLQGLLRQQIATFVEDETAARALIEIGDAPIDARWDPAELAAWTTLCSILLNLDETITKS